MTDVANIGVITDIIEEVEVFDTKTKEVTYSTTIAVKI